MLCTGRGRGLDTFAWACSTQAWDSAVDAHEFELNGMIYTREKDGKIIDEGRGPEPRPVTLTTRDLMNVVSVSTRGLSHPDQGAAGLQAGADTNAKNSGSTLPTAAARHDLLHCIARQGRVQGRRCSAD
jgi:hypothetical protein